MRPKWLLNGEGIDNLVIIHDTPQIAGTIAATLKLMDYPSVHILQ